jgi:glutamine cyclotransferase
MRGFSILRLQRLAGTEALPTVVGGTASLPASDFGEGICPWPPADEWALPDGDDAALAGVSIYQLTWQERRVHKWGAEALLRGDAPSGHTTATFGSTKNEGWGLTTDGAALIESDGSSYLHWWGAEPVDGAMPSLGRKSVVDRVRSAGVSRPDGVRFGERVEKLNELEYVHGWVLGNVWYQPQVAIIHPGTGAVVQYLDFSPLVAANRAPPADCLNGLAYTTRLDVDATLPPESGSERVARVPWGGRLWLTGKYWSHLYEIELGGLVEADTIADFKDLPTGFTPAARRAHAKGGRRA